MATSTYIIIMAVCLILSAYFSATETAFSSVNTTKLKALAEKGNKKAALACRLEEQYGKLISTVLIGNNIVNIAMASLGTVIFVRAVWRFGCDDLHGRGDGGGIDLRRNFAEEHRKGLCGAVHNVFCAVHPVLDLGIHTTEFPVLALEKAAGEAVLPESDSRMSQEELLMLVDEVQQDGSIDKNEGELLKNAIEFSEQEAQDIVVHRVDLAALPVGSSPEEIAAMFSETKHSRLLVYEGSIDNILGTVHQKDFYVGCGITDKPLREICRRSFLCSKMTDQPAAEEIAEGEDAHRGRGRRIWRHVRHRDDGGHTGGAGRRDLG